MAQGFAAAEDRVLRSIVEVRALSSEVAAKRLPVVLEAQIMKLAPTGHGAYIHDGRTGIYLARKAFASFNRVKRGQLIRIEGVTNPGRFIPHIDGEKITPLKMSSLPAPLQPDREMLYRPSMDCQWIELQGVVLDNIPQGQATSLRIECFGNIVNLVLPNTPDAEEFAERHRNRMISARGVATTRSNERRQMIDRQMQVHSLDDVKLLDDEQGGLPLMEIDQLSRMESGDLKTARVQGVVLHSNRHVLYLKGNKGYLKVIASEDGNWERGDKVEAKGSVVLETFSPAIRAWKVIVLREQKPLSEPSLMPLAEATIPLSLQHSLVQVEANLVNVRESEKSIALSCEAQGRVFEASLDRTLGLMPALEPGSILNLSGICLLRSSQDEAHAFQPDGFSLILRSPTDIRVLQTPPWWTLRKALLISSLVLLLTLISLAWVGLLRKKVGEQTSVIGAQLEREVRTKERQRLARELHDSLEQNLTGIAMQLGTIEKKIEDDTVPKIGDSLTLAQRMVAHCQRESRESIYDLRRSGEGTLSEITHDELLLNEAETYGAEIKVSTEGESYPILNTASNHLTKFVREATLNALRHGKAKLVNVDYSYSESGIEIRVADDGSGFDTSQPLPKGHFGIRGMKERAGRLNGKLTIESLIGKGTSLTLNLPKGEALIAK